MAIYATLPHGILGLQLSVSIQRLGLLLGNPQGLSSHVLRREAANAVDCAVTPGDVGRGWSLLIQRQRNQIMGHARVDASRRYYMHQTVEADTQSDYLGAANRQSH